MKKMIIIVFTVIFWLTSFTSIVSSHVPYIERIDYSEEKPLFIWKMLEYSKAFYAWLENDGINPCEDIDVFKFKIRNKPINIYIEIIVPTGDGYYEDFVPWYALIGPGLPEPNQMLPFTLPPGYGAIVKENVEPGEERGTFYEPFGGKWYYKGPIFEETLSDTGTYYIYCWDPYAKGGDYVLVIGKGEFFGPLDIIRSIINTIIIRGDGELHIIKYLIIE
jgi:hypothetical protein